MSVAAVVVSYEAREVVGACLEALDGELGEGEVVVVDNGSADGTPALVRERFPGMRVLELGENRGFPAAVNAGVAATGGAWVLVLNPDMVLAPGAVRELVAVGERSARCGAVAAQVRFAARPGVLNSAGIVVDRLGVARDRRLRALPPGDARAGRRLRRVVLPLPRGR